MTYKPPTRVSNLDVPWISLVTRADEDWARDKYYQIEYEFAGNPRNWRYANPYVRGAYGGFSNVYPVGQPFGDKDPDVFGQHLQSGVPTGGWA